MWLSPEIRLYAITLSLPSWSRCAREMSALSAPLQLRVPRVAQRISEEVEAEDGEADGQAGEDGEPGGLLHERASGAAQHEAPRGVGRLRAHAEEAQRGLDEDRVAEPDRRDDQDRRGDVG